MVNTFPCKLYELLERADSLGYSNIISWQPGGKSFRVWNPRELEASILPQHFKQSKFKSFLRQLNTYHFQRITSGVNRGGYAHPCLVRGKYELSKSIKRVPDMKEHAKAGAVRPLVKPANLTSSPAVVPPCHFGSKSFFDVLDTPIPPRPGRPVDLTPREQSINNSSNKTEITSKDLDVFVDLFEPSSANDLKAFRETSMSSLDPMNDIMVGALPRNTPAGIGAELEPIPVLPPVQDQVPVPSVPAPAPIAAHTVSTNGDLQRSESTFPRKVYRMLQDVDKIHMDHIVSWINGGTAFRVHNQDAFVKQILPLYFDQTVYESFRRQLNMYGFTRVTRGPLKGTCYHKHFCRHEPADLDLITRRKRPSKKNKKNNHMARGRSITPPTPIAATPSSAELLSSMVC